jgi:hypothetical protein
MGPEERKAGAPGEALNAGLLPMRNFLRQRDGEEIAIRPLLLFSARGEIAVDAGRVGQVEVK